MDSVNASQTLVSQAGRLLPAPTASPTATSAPAQAIPADGYAPGGASPPDLSLSEMERLSRLALGKGPASALGFLFGKDCDRVEQLERLPAGKDMPAGGWHFVCRYPPKIANGTYDRTLSNSVPAGWSSAWGQSYSPPLGLWTRRPDGWESSYRHVEKDKDSALESSMLRLFLGDDGKAQMVLWERLREGGGIFYQLDAERWLQHPDQKPEVLDMVPYGPQDAQQAPFFKPAAGEGPPLWSQFFGPSAPKVKIAEFVPNEHVKEGGASVELNFEWGGMRNVYIPLNGDSPTGFVHESYRMEDHLYQRWVRTADGWVGETQARMTPDHHANLADVTLRTELDAKGTVRSMVLAAEGLRGERTAYVLDASRLVSGESREPRVVDVRHTGPTEPPKAPKEKAAPRPAPGIQNEDGWIIINGVRVPKKQP